MWTNEPQDDGFYFIIDSGNLSVGKIHKPNIHCITDYGQYCGVQSIDYISARYLKIEAPTEDQIKEEQKEINKYVKEKRLKKLKKEIEEIENELDKTIPTKLE